MMNPKLKYIFAALGLSVSFHLPASAAVFTVTENFWGTSTTTNSFAWALDQANTNPGADTIDLRLTSGSSIDVDGVTYDRFVPFLSQITESVQIRGNGVTLVGNPQFFTNTGLIVTKNNNTQPFRPPSDTLTVPAHSFAEVAPSVSVEINDLNADGLNGFLKLGANSIATIVNSAIKNTVPYGFTGRPALEALSGSTLNLRNVLLDRINPFESVFNGSEYAWVGAIFGSNGATLNMVNSIIRGSSTSIGAINWAFGGTANVVSSIISGNAGGLSIEGDGGVLNFVNSILYLNDSDILSPVARIQAYGNAVANVIASTVQFNPNMLNSTSLGPCITDPTRYSCNGAPLQAFGGGKINLVQSAISTINTSLTPEIDDFYSNFFGVSGILTADALSYVQPTQNSSPDDLRTLFSQPSLLTGLLPYELTSDLFLLPTYQELPDGASLLSGSPLRSAIADADGANQLINPIDGSVITTDVFGNPRTAFGTRDIGAVQGTQEVPGPLPVLGAGAAFGWARRLRKRVRQHSLENAAIPSPRG